MPIQPENKQEHDRLIMHTEGCKFRFEPRANCLPTNSSISQTGGLGRKVCDDVAKIAPKITFLLGPGLFSGAMLRSYR